MFPTAGHARSAGLIVAERSSVAMLDLDQTLRGANRIRCLSMRLAEYRNDGTESASAEQIQRRVHTASNPPGSAGVPALLVVCACSPVHSDTCLEYGPDRRVLSGVQLAFDTPWQSAQAGCADHH